MVENRHFSYPLNLMPPRNSAIMFGNFGMEKLEWWGYLDHGTKNFEDTFSGADRIPACNRRKTHNRHLATA